jgi:hypothetical protein
MARKTAHRRHKRGGRSLYVSETQPGNPNLPYSAPIKEGGRRNRRKMRGGTGSSLYSSASSYGSYVNGTENSQYDRVFSQSGPYASVQGNMSIGAQGQNANLVGAPNAGSLSLIQSAGTKRRHKRVHRTKKRRGGFLGQVINQAIVPFTLLGMQQKYRRNKSNHSSTKSRRRYK